MEVAAFFEILFPPHCILAVKRKRREGKQHAKKSVWQMENPVYWSNHPDAFCADTADGRASVPMEDVFSGDIKEDTAVYLEQGGSRYGYQSLQDREYYVQKQELYRNLQDTCDVSRKETGMPGKRLSMGKPYMWPGT